MSNSIEEENFELTEVACDKEKDRKSGKLKGTFGRFGNERNSGRKLLSLSNRTFSASSDTTESGKGTSISSSDHKDSGVPYSSYFKRKSCQNEGDSSGRGGNSFKQEDIIYVADEEDDDEFSTGLPSDLPSGMCDIEGEIIGDANNIQFGQDFEDDLDEVSSLPTDNDINHTIKNKSKIAFLKGKGPLFKKKKEKSESIDSKTSSSILSSIGKKSLFSKNSKSSTVSDNSFELRRFGGATNKNDKWKKKNKLLQKKSNSTIETNFDEHDPLNRMNSTGASSSQSSTITQHYYPECGFGYCIVTTTMVTQALVIGFQLSTGLFIYNLVDNFGQELYFDAVWLGSFSFAFSLLFSPLWISICKRKSTRLSAVFGGLIASLGCLFTSFASQFHQLFFSYGAFMAIGIGLTRDAATLMVGQYFKRKREKVEIIVVSGSGIGLLLMSISVHMFISSFGWRLGLQAVTLLLFLTFFLGTCYRSASLYHPQRRAILHLKNQKRKIKDKEKRDDKPPFIDWSCLKSKTLQILILSSAFIAFGINTPLFYLAIECSYEDVDDFSLVLLHIYVGASWVLGCLLFGFIVVQKNQDCRISKQYLCQVASILCGISIITITAVKGFSGLVIFSWVYGFSLGGYNYALKVYTFQQVRARNFPRAWSFIQCSQSIPLCAGVLITGYMNEKLGWKCGYFLSAASVIIGSLFLFITDVRKRRLSRRKTQNSSMKTCETLETTAATQSPKPRNMSSFSFPMQMSPTKNQMSGISEGNGQLDPSLLAKELTCISEEGGIGDMDFQDIYFEEWADYFGSGGDCITSCNKVENCLASEYNQADPEYSNILDRRRRRLSSGPKEIPVFRNYPGIKGANKQGRAITVIDEASV